MNRTIIALSVASLWTSAANAEVFLKMNPQEQQASRMVDGRRWTDNVGTAATVRFIAPKPSYKKRGAFAIYVANAGEQPFDIGPEAVSAHLDDGTPVPILTYAQLMKEQRRREWWQNFGQALSAMSAANAGQRTGTATYSGYSTGSFGSTPFQSSTTGVATYQGNDPAAQAIAMAENRRRAAALAMDQASARQQIDSVLQLTTVDPGQVHGGMVLFDIPRSARRGKRPIPVTFTIQAGGESHVFRGVFEPD